MENIIDFEELRNAEILKLETICDKWNGLCTNENIPEDEMGSIISVIGQTKLLLNGKFKQFTDLIDISLKRNAATYIVTNDELQGFWDLIKLQIDDIHTKFNELEQLKANNWVAVVRPPDDNDAAPKVTESRKNPPRKKAPTVRKVYSEASKAKINAVKKQMKSKLASIENFYDLAG